MWYVDGSARSELELGTKLLPYKYLNYALIEILNEFTEEITSTEVTIFLKEGVRTYLYGKVTTVGAQKLMIR